MAGITNGEFAVRALNAGVGGVVLGSYNIDRQVLSAAYQSTIRGRCEFCYPLETLAQRIIHEVDTVRSSHKDQAIFVSLRFSDTNSVHEIANELSEVSLSPFVIEINAHCRQREIRSLGAGQSLLERPEKIEEAIKYLKEKDFLVSVKTRSPGLDCRKFAKQLVHWGGDIFHLDAYIPGTDGPDISLISQATSVDDILIIGNNSINNAKIASQVLSTGAIAFSTARAAMTNPGVIGKIVEDLRNFPERD